MLHVALCRIRASEAREIYVQQSAVAGRREREREEVEARERGRGRWQRALIDSQWLWGWRHFNSELLNRYSGAAERQRESVKESERVRKRGGESERKRAAARFMATSCIFQAHKTNLIDEPEVCFEPQREHPVLIGN